MQRKLVFLLASLGVISGCASMVGGSNVSDESLQSAVAGVFGDDPANVSIESRRSEGTNTYFIAKMKNGNRFACNFLGGGILTYGARTAPTCNPIAK